MLDEKIKLLINNIVVDTNNNNATGSEKEGNYPRDFGMDFWDWTQGVSLYGLYNSKELTDYDIDTYIKKWYETMDAQEVIKNINTTCPLLTMLLSDNGDEVHEWANWLKYDLHKTKNDVFQHTTSNIDGTGILENDGQVWADTIFMTVIFLLSYGIKYDDQQMIDEAHYQILMHTHLLFDRATGLYFHGYSYNDKNNFGGVHWLRGNGWIFYAYALVLETIDESSTYYRYYESVFKDMCETIVDYQQENGLYNTIVDKDSYSEVSGSCLVALALIKGYRNGVLDDKYLSSAQKTVDAVLERITEDGKVLDVSAGTSIGMNEEHYHNIVTNDMPYGKSLALLLLVEYKKTKGEIK